MLQPSLWMSRPPVTAAVRALRAAGIEFEEHTYDFVDNGGTHHAARCLGLDEHAVVKTLVMHDDRREPLLVLMHGDRQVSTQALARQIGARSVAPVTPQAASRITGYVVGGISPFGTRKPLRVFVEASVLELTRIFVNGGKRGFLVGVAPAELGRLLRPTPVQVAMP
jgi:Cys-tRNA(Pro) deacylase